jgi:hypothetical protein
VFRSGPVRSSAPGRTLGRCSLLEVENSCVRARMFGDSRKWYLLETPATLFLYRSLTFWRLHVFRILKLLSKTLDLCSQCMWLIVPEDFITLTQLICTDSNTL